jgi:uncharacterized protein YrrD
MRLKDIRGLPVVDPTAARKIGTIADYLVDPSGGRLAALEVAPKEGGEANERVPAHRVRRIGQHAVVLTGRPATNRSSTLDSAVSERWLDSASLTNLEVLGDDGNRVGYVTDATLDQDTLDIQAYLLRGSLWERFFGRRRGRIQPPQVASCSRELMIVSTGRLTEASTVATSEETSGSLGVPLKLEDRPPAPATKEAKAEDGQAVPAAGRSD